MNITSKDKFESRYMCIIRYAHLSSLRRESDWLNNVSSTQWIPWICKASWIPLSLFQVWYLDLEGSKSAFRDIQLAIHLTLSGFWTPADSPLTGLWAPLQDLPLSISRGFTSDRALWTSREFTADRTLSTSSSDKVLSAKGFTSDRALSNSDFKISQQPEAVWEEEGVRSCGTNSNTM
jgi:hypothetical protein